MNQVRAYINAPRPVDRVLFEAGILKPWLIGGTDIFKDHAFAKCDLDEFLLNLAAGAKPVTNDEIHLVPILKAQKLANCSTLKVVQLILERRVRTLRTDPKETGFLSILVDPEEVKSLVRGKDHAGYSLRQVEKKLKTSTNVVKALVELGYLEAETAINPVKRCRQTIVKREILDAFMNKFETASSLSRRLGIHLQTLMKHLRCSGSNQSSPLRTFTRQSTIEKSRQRKRRSFPNMSNKKSPDKLQNVDVSSTPALRNRSSAESSGATNLWLDEFTERMTHPGPEEEEFFERRRRSSWEQASMKMETW